jgi:hypothetical protein
MSIDLSHLLEVLAVRGYPREIMPAVFWRTTTDLVLTSMDVVWMYSPVCALGKIIKGILLASSVQLK